MTHVFFSHRWRAAALRRHPLAALLAALLVTAGTAQAQTFATQVAFSTGGGSNPFGVAAADVNGDGKPDLLTANSSTNNVSVLLNTTATNATTPTFAAQVVFSTGSGPYSVAAADVNGDGKPDLLTANYDGSNASVLLNTTATNATTPTFATQVTFSTGSSPASVAAADVNGDGKPDLLVANYGGSNASVLLNTTATNATTPTFAAQVVFSTGSGPYSVAAADVNGDGKPDLLTANYSGNNASVLRNTTSPPNLVVSTTGTIPAGTYGTITVNSPAVATLAGNVTVTTGFTVNSGATLNGGSCYIISGAGSFTLAAGATLGICDPAGIAATGATGAVQVTGTRSFSPDASYLYNGTVAQSTGTGLPATVRSLALNNAQGATLSSANLTATQALTMSSGLLTTGSYTATLGSSATLTEAATNYVLGTVQTTRPVSTAGSAQSFGGLGLSLTPASGSPLPGSTLVRRVTGTALNGQGTSTSIKRYYDIQPATNAGLNVTVQLGYLDAELNGISEANLRIFRSSTGTSGPWEAIAVSSRDATANTVTATNVEHFSIWTLGSAANPLPVQLVAFTAQPAGPAAVRLAWTTASEVNSARFEVERSPDGRTFAAVGTVAAAGSSSSARHYQYLDAAAPAGRLYYRLRQVDLDGTAAYSPVQAVTLAGGATLALYPNPAHGPATVSGLPAGTAVQVLDALGRPVLATRADEAGQATLALPAGLAPGLYLVRGGTQVARLVVE